MAKDKQVETFTHDSASRRNIPTAELQSFVQPEEAEPKAVRYARNPDLDPQLVWRGKDGQDWSDLVVHAPPLYIQEKVHPKAIIEALRRDTCTRRAQAPDDDTPDLFADFNGLTDPELKTDFYQHDLHWSNRMILGDSLQVMASLAEREGLRGQVQSIYIDPPYGIKFNSNWQISTRSRDVKDGKPDQISREPEQIKAFRDTWKDGIHSYLTYLRDRLTVARDLLAETGSIFVQIGDENVHRVRALMDEVFGPENLIALIVVEKTSGSSMRFIDNVSDFVLWYSKRTEDMKYRPIFSKKDIRDFIYEYKFVQDNSGYRDYQSRYIEGANTSNVYAVKPLTSQTNASTTIYDFAFQGRVYQSGKRQWATPLRGMKRLEKANRIEIRASSIGFVRFFDDFPVAPVSNIWTDTGTGSFTDPKIYVVQTTTKAVQRCILMSTDPGDLVLDPTCGSGTTAYVAEQWGRRWITIDTSRVALALARTRLMTARYPWYLLADSPEGRKKEGELRGKPLTERPTHNDLRQGFVYERVSHITLKAIANNAEIDTLWDEHAARLDPLRRRLTALLREHGLADTGKPDDLEEWQLPREAPNAWPNGARDLLAEWWDGRIARQRAIDASIARNADIEYLHDRPYEDKSKVRVAGPFTVDSLSPHRVAAADSRDDLAEDLAAADGRRARKTDDTAADFAQMVLEQLRGAGVQQAKKQDRIRFDSLTPWPGRWIAATGRYRETADGADKTAGVFIGPEFGTVTRADLVAAAREAREAAFDLLVACAFSYDTQASDFTGIGPLPVVRARMNPDLHMADELKPGTGNLFVVFGEPDIEIAQTTDGLLQVRILGVDVFDPQKGEVRAGDTEDIAAWFIDTDYDEESFLVRHAYFLGAAADGSYDPYKALKTTLKAEIDADAWASLYRDLSRPFPRPAGGRIAVKVINHFGDEVMKVYAV